MPRRHCGDRGREEGDALTNEQRQQRDDALRAVLLFFSASPWDVKKKLKWLTITGTTECTTKVLCDHIRSVLKEDEAIITARKPG
jgi:hypothetical protein